MTGTMRGPESARTKKPLAPVIPCAVVLILAASGTWYFLYHAGQHSALQEPVTLAVQPVESSALIYIAEDRGFFSDNGLAVRTRDFDPPAEGVNAMLRCEEDLASATEYPTVLRAFGRQNISIIATHVKVQSIYILARKDRGIETINDLKGKRIGVNRGTLTEFYLGRFLTLHAIGPDEVTFVNTSPPKLVDEFVAGRIDALVTYDPYITEIRLEMNDAVLEWPANGGQPAFGVITARNDWIAQDPDRVVRFLKSLDMAADYAANYPAESRAIVKKRLNQTDAYMEARWPANQFGLSLDQSLVLAMEDEARWTLANNLTEATPMPDFSRYVYTNGLVKVNPGSVNIIAGVR